MVVAIFDKISDYAGPCIRAVKGYLVCTGVMVCPFLLRQRVRTSLCVFMIYFYFFSCLFRTFENTTCCEPIRSMACRPRLKFLSCPPAPHYKANYIKKMNYSHFDGQTIYIWPVDRPVTSYCLDSGMTLLFLHTERIGSNRVKVHPCSVFARTLRMGYIIAPRPRCCRRVSDY